MSIFKDVGVDFLSLLVLALIGGAIYYEIGELRDTQFYQLEQARKAINKKCGGMVGLIIGLCVCNAIVIPLQTTILLLQNLFNGSAFLAIQSNKIFVIGPYLLLIFITIPLIILTIGELFTILLASQRIKYLQKQKEEIQ